MSSASARHILVDSEEKCNQLKSEIENGVLISRFVEEFNSILPLYILFKPNTIKYYKTIKRVFEMF